ncbi:MAG: TonB-dependent receptor [Gemmatimonadota bacterium]|nr:TonB-dependent receptor [Gemmatimonadota bacterium]
MRDTSFIRHTLICATLLLASAVGVRRAEAQTGKLTGVVTDATTGQPIEGVQVFLQGTGYGAITQPNGRYFVIAIPPGTYTVTARRIGYQTQQTNTQILIDVTREIGFKLSTAGATLQTVKVIETTRPLVELTQTGTTQQITTQELEALPIRSINDALTLQSGFQEIPTISTDLTSFTSSRRNNVSPILIRGGRAGETMTLIDDIPVNNFLFGGPTLDITRKAIENISIKKGGLEPQYGNALSGVVSLATKEGGTNLTGSIEYETSRVGGSLGYRQDELRGYDFIEGFLSGPVPATADKLRFVVAGRTQSQADQVLQFDNQVFNPFVRDTVHRAPVSDDLFSGWRALGFQAERDVFGKLTYLFQPTTKLSVSTLHYERERQQIPFDWELTGYSPAQACINLYQRQYGANIDVVDACNTYYGSDRTNASGRPQNGTSERSLVVFPATVSQIRDLYTARFEQTSGRLNYKLVGGVFNQKRGTCATYFSGVCLGERIADTNFNGRFVTPGVTSQDVTPTEGTDRIAGNDRMRTVLGRFDLQLQATDHHNLAGGLFYQGHDIHFREVTDVGLNNIFLQPSDYAAKPWDAAAYLQDKIEYDFVTISIGGRFDYGNAKGTFLNDPLDPTNGTTELTVCNNPTRFGLAAGFARFVSGDTVFNGIAACQHPLNKAIGDSATRIAFRDDMGPARSRRAFSPRVGINFPVTERSSAFFNYGIYYQNPLYNNVYQGTGIGTPNEGTPLGPAFTNGTFVGNPQLRAEQTTSYEMGYQTEFGRNFSLQVVAFNKDQSGLTGIRNGGFVKGTVTRVFDPGLTYGTNAPNYTVLVNQDFQTSRGVELEFRRRLANYWSGRVNYAYQKVRTNAAPPDLQQQQTVDEGDVVARAEIRSDIDQTHAINAILTFAVLDQAPSFRFASLLKNASLSFTGRYQSGYPYTPSLTFTGNTNDRLDRNSGTGTSIFRVDMEAEKGWYVSNVRYGAFVRVANLLDRKNCLQVFATTGNCEGGASPQARLAAGNFTGENESSTFFDRPQYQDIRRTINAGLRVSF